MSVLYRLYQNNNKKNTKAYGKWYAKAVTTNVYSTDELALEVQRNCSMKKSDVKAVIEELCEVMARELGNSHVIELVGVGRFYPKVSSTLRRTSCTRVSASTPRRSVCRARGLSTCP